MKLEMKHQLKALNHILSKDKLDSRTLKNTVAILSALNYTSKLEKKFLSGKEIMYRVKDQTSSSSVVYDILNDLERTSILEVVKANSRGVLGKKKLYKIKPIGVLLLGALTSNHSLISETVMNFQPSNNPILKFNASLGDAAQEEFKETFSDMDKIYSKGLLKGFSQTLKMDEVIAFATNEMFPIIFNFNKKYKKLDFVKKWQKIYLKALEPLVDYEKRVVFTHFKNEFNNAHLKKLSGPQLKAMFNLIQSDPYNIHAICPSCKNTFSLSYEEFINGLFSLCPECRNVD